MADVAPALVPKLFSFAERIVMRISCDAAVVCARPLTYAYVGLNQTHFPH